MHEIWQYDIIKNMKDFLRATATLSGMIIGVGIFGVPYVASKYGLDTVLFWIVILGGVSLTLSLFYGQIVMHTPGRHRLAGYVSRYFGKNWKRPILILDILRSWGLQIAYLIVGGTFLCALLKPYFGGDVFFYSVILFACVALVTFFGTRMLGQVEFLMTGFLVLAMFAVSFKGLAHFNIQNFILGNANNFFAPYGVVMVALSGVAAIPELWDITHRKPRVFQASIIVGTLIPVLVTALFALGVVGASGINTSKEAIMGLEISLGPNIVMLGALAGFLAVITSYFVIALYLQETLRYDFLVKHTPAWFFATAIPLVLFVVGMQDFIAIVDIVGSIFMGLEGLLIIGLGMLIMSKHRKGHWSVFGLGILMAGMFVFGIIQKLI